MVMSISVDLCEESQIYICQRHNCMFYRRSPDMKELGYGLTRISSRASHIPVGKC